jgi:hypothetical protein
VTCLDKVNEIILLCIVSHFNMMTKKSWSVTRSLVLYVCFVDRCVSFCTFSFGHCVVCYLSSLSVFIMIHVVRYLVSMSCL